LLQLTLSRTAGVFWADLYQWQGGGQGRFKRHALLRFERTNHPGWHVGSYPAAALLKPGVRIGERRARTIVRPMTRIVAGAEAVLCL
jgi:hypothetical protein